MRIHAHSVDAERCGSYDLDTGRCQLTAGHGGPHAIRNSDAYLTWDLHETSHWSVGRPPPWVLDLYWAIGLHPHVSACE